MLVGEVTHSMVHRIFLEEVNGVQQGACFPFLHGFMSGPVALEFAEEGFLFAGQTDRGWGSRGGNPFGFQRVKWTGETPFEVHEMRVTPDGWELTFTQPVDPATAGDVASYNVKSWIYWLQSKYGSEEIEHTDQTVTAAVVADDGMSVRLTVDGRVKGHLHQIDMEGVRSPPPIPTPACGTRWATTPSTRSRSSRSSPPPRPQSRTRGNLFAARGAEPSPVSGRITSGPNSNRLIS